MHNLKRESFITILSTRRSGKSFLIAELIYDFMNNKDINNKCDLLYLFSNTAKFEQMVNYNFVDSKIIFKANPENVEKIITRLLEIQLQTKKKYHVLCVFDDIDLSKKYEQSIELLATRGRHYNITTILSAQVATNCISPCIRNNTSYLFFRKLNTETIKKQIYSMVINNQFNSAEEFKTYVNNNISDFNFIFYDNDTDEKELKVIKAKPIPTDYKYKVAEPKIKKSTIQPKFLGYGQPMTEWQKLK